jgi:MoaA/NifB/PqqE/SkfB family radical SAM enzyme
MRLIRVLQRYYFGARYALRLQRNKRRVLAHLADPRPETLPMPTFVQLKLTNLCNLRCKMCGQWGDTGMYRPDAALAAEDGAREKRRIRDLIGFGRQLGLDDYTRLLDEIAPFKPVICLFGGEPLLYPDVVPLMREVKRRGLTLTLITNAWQLPELAREIVEIGVDSIAVSVDGPPALHDRIRGREGSFARLAEGVRAVAAWRHRLNRPLPLQMAILPVTELNLSQIESAWRELYELPLEVINIGLRWFVPRAVGERYEEVMQREFGVAGTSWKGFEFAWPGGREGTATPEMRALTQWFSRLRVARVGQVQLAKPWTSFVPDVEPADVPAYFTEFDRTFGHDFCPVAWTFAQVEPDGEVCFCGDFPDYFIGNVRRQPFREIWTGPRAAAFRRKLAREPLPICNRCCGNYVHGKWPAPQPARGRRPATVAIEAPLPVPAGSPAPAVVTGSSSAGGA